MSVSLSCLPREHTQLLSKGNDPAFPKHSSSHSQSLKRGSWVMCNPDVVKPWSRQGPRTRKSSYSLWSPQHKSHTLMCAHTHTIYIYKNGDSITSIKTPIQRTTLWFPSCLWKLLPCPPSSLAAYEAGYGEDCLLREQELSWNIFWSQGLRECELF